MLLRTSLGSALAVAAAFTAVSVTGLAGVASAAPARSTTVSSPQIAPTTVERVKHPIKDSFSAGIEGYGDTKCAGLLKDYNTLLDYATGAALDGDKGAEDSYDAQANQVYDQMTDNCAVIT
jgi:hypothetical protein